ncbi:MAG TPA: hypothetical protein VF116_23485 [Ktedonobacterales bacterium]
MATGYISGLIVPTPAMPCAGTRMRMRVWGVRVAAAPFGGGTAGCAAPIISEGRAFNWHDTR